MSLWSGQCILLSLLYKPATTLGKYSAQYLVRWGPTVEQILKEIGGGEQEDLICSLGLQ